MNNILVWNVRGLNKAKKQLDMAHFLAQHNVNLFGLLETKVKQNKLGSLYQRLCPGRCFSHNLPWDNSERIIIGWKPPPCKLTSRVAVTN